VVVLQPMSHGYDYDGEPDFEIPDGYISADEAFSHVVEHEWDDVLQVVADERNEEWLQTNRPYLDLAGLVSRHDRDQLRDLIRLGISAERSPTSDTLPEAHLFTVAAEVCSFLESLASARAECDPRLNLVSGNYWLSRKPDPVSSLLACRDCCSLEGELDWTRELILATRTFRDLLFVVGDPSDPLFHSEKLGSLLSSFNSTLQRDSNARLVYWYAPNKEINFGRAQTNQESSLTACMVRWFSDYLVEVYPTLGLSACVECGVFFHRQRKDNVYCSKTCQNRVAYKRKKILETKALTKLHVNPNTTAEIGPGLLFHHGRLGLGIVEAVQYDRGTMLDSLPPTSPESFRERLTTYRAKSIRMRVLFPHGVRMLNYAEMFDAKKEEALHQFYSISEPEIAAGLF